MEIIQYFEDGTYRSTTISHPVCMSPLDARDEVWSSIQNETGQFWEQLQKAKWDYTNATPGMDLYGGFHIGSHTRSVVGGD
eukprot:SAG11_NODE_1062_length_5998_cov_67.555518_2_plen_81_part_00